MHSARHARAHAQCMRHVRVHVRVLFSLHPRPRAGRGVHRKGNATARGAAKQRSYTQESPDLMWGFCRAGGHITSTQCSCGKYGQVNPLARTGGIRGPIGTRINHSKECKDQRPVGPEELKTR